MIPLQAKYGQRLSQSCGALPWGCLILTLHCSLILTLFPGARLESALAALDLGCLILTLPYLNASRDARNKEARLYSKLREGILDTR